VSEINRLLAQFKEMGRFMKGAKSAKGPHRLGRGAF
jgi:signal recognition particle GTPase